MIALQHALLLLSFASAADGPELAPTAAPATAAPAMAAPKRVAVMKTEVVGDVDAALAPQITSKLAEEIRAQTKAEVISSDEIIALLKHEKERAIIGECKEQESCLAELANALGAEVVVSAKLTSAPVVASDGTTSARQYALAVSAVNASSASVVGRVNEAWGGDALGLLSLVRPVTTKLFATTSIPKGSVEVIGAVAGSKIVIDDQVRGSAELSTVSDLLVGAHHVVVQHDDMKPVDKWVIVDADQKASLPVAQEGLGGPFYSSWWFWTGAGAVVAVAGATTAGVLLLNVGKTGVNVQVNADKTLGGAR